MNPGGPISLDEEQRALLRRSAPMARVTDQGTVSDACQLLLESFPEAAERDWTPAPPRPAGPPLPGLLPLSGFPGDALAADGYAVVGPLVGPAGLAALRCAADRLQAAAFAASGMARYEDWVARVSQVPDPADWDPAFASLEAHPAIAEAAARALGRPSTRCLWSHLVIKPPGVGSPLPWHTDRPTWPFPASVPAVALWLALDPLGEGRGGLWYQPDSPVCPAPPASALLLHHGDTLHCSRANTSDRWRRAWIGVFGALE